VQKSGLARGFAIIDARAHRRQATEDRIEQRQDQNVRIRFHDGAMAGDSDDRLNTTSDSKSFRDPAWAREVHVFGCA
jgi:hypothetical protein